jgi:hypothetical protein
MARRNGSRRGLRSLPSLGVLLCALGWARGAGATVAEQRARLPPPAECEDEVEGLWRAHQFWDWRSEWYVMTLEIHRVKKGEPALTGTIRSEYWHGEAKDQQPPPCPTRYHFIVRMPAVGSYQTGDVAFGGTSWTLDQAPCGGRPGRYNPDKFTGRIDPKIQEFQSVNNDGGAAVNVATVFRRIQCFDAPGAAVPTVEVRPPAFRPKTKRGGCGCELGAEPRAPGQGSLAAGLGAAALGAARSRRRRASLRGALAGGPWPGAGRTARGPSPDGRPERLSRGGASS